MMKKILKFSTVFLLLVFTLFLIFDNAIVKYLIINNAEKITKKRVELERVNLQYFPTVELELINFKLPDPYNDQYLISSNKILIQIRTEPLFFGRLIIENMIFDETKLFEANDNIEAIRNDVLAEEKTVDSTVVDQNIKEAVKNILSSFDISKISSVGDQQFDFNEQFSEVDSVIEHSNQVIKRKQAAVLSKVNTLLYDINNIKVGSFNSLDQILEIQKTINQISKKSQFVSDEVESLSSIYDETLASINQIEKSINAAIDNSLSFEASDSKVVDYSSFIGKSIKQFFKRKKLSKSSKKQPKFEGVTYSFSQKKLARVLIENFQINDKKSDYYSKGVNLTLDKAYDKQSTFFIKVLNQSFFKKMELSIKSDDRRAFNVLGHVEGLKFNQKKLFEDDKFVVYILENDRVSIHFSGDVSSSSDINSTISIIKPYYRVVNKSAKNGLVNNIFQMLNEQSLELTLKFKGNFDKNHISTKTNLDQIIDSIKESFLSSSIAAYKKDKLNEINAIKKEQMAKIRDKKQVFSEYVQKNVKQLKFQEQEIDSRKSLIQKEINNKKKQLENKVQQNIENTLKKNLKKIKLL